MIEIINIFIFPIILILFLQNNLLSKFFIISNKNQNLDLEYKILNFFIILNLLLILSLLNLAIKVAALIIIFYFIFSNIFYFKINKNFLFISKYTIFLVIFYLLSLDIASNPDLSWDGKFHWYKRALNFYQDMGYENLKLLPKYEYPHLGSYLWAFFWFLNPSKIEYFGRLFFVFLYLFSIFSVSDLISNKTVKHFVFIFISLISYNLNHFTGNQDIVVFSLIIFLTRNLYLIYISRDNSYLNYFLFILVNNIIIWIKYESFLYVLLSYGVLIFLNLIDKNKKIFFLLVFFLLATILFKIYISTIFQIGFNASFQFSGNYDVSELFKVDIILYKLYILLKYFLFALFKNPILIIGFISLLIIFLKKIKIPNPILIFFILMNCSAIFVFYIIQIDFKWHVINGLDRYVLQFSGMSILFIVLLLNYFYKK